MHHLIDGSKTAGKQGPDQIILLILRIKVKPDQALPLLMQVFMVLMVMEFQYKQYLLLLRCRVTFPCRYGHPQTSWG